MKKILTAFILGLFLLSFTSAVCSLELESEDYSQGESLQVTGLCDSSTEKLKAYTITLSYSNGTSIDTSVGTTPSTVNNPFFATFSSSGLIGIVNVTLTGSNLEGTDWANISGVDSGSLFITDGSFSPYAFLGSLFAIDFKVEDENGKLIDGASCFVDSTDNSNAPLQSCGSVKTIAGEASCSSKLDNEAFLEGQNYLARVRCSCGSSESQCFDEDGNAVTNSNGKISYPFTTSTWLYANTVVNKDSYVGREEMMISVNLTNVENIDRIPVEIYHQVRCSRGLDNDYDTDRALILSDDGKPDERGVSINTTQMQSKRFIINELNYMQGTTSTCYASTSVWVLNDNREKIKNYVTSSPPFNITFNDVNVDADWEMTALQNFSTTIDFSDDKFSYLDISGMHNVDIRLDKNYFESIRAEDQYLKYPQDLENFILLEYVKSVTARDSSGNTLHSSVELLDDGNVEIEVDDVNFSDSPVISVNMLFNSFNERMANATERIADSAGTFDFSINVASTSTNTVTVIGEGLTGTGQTLNRDLNIKCQVDGFPETYTEFKVFCTDSFAFATEVFNTPTSFGTYTMRCTAIDSFMGEDAVQAVANFNKVLSGGIGDNAEVEEVVSDENLLDKTGDVIKKNPMIFIILGALVLFMLVYLVFWLFSKRDDKEE